MEKYNQKVLDGIARELEQLDCDSYLLHHHKELYHLCNECDIILSDKEDIVGPKRNVSMVASIYLTKEYFKSINRRYSMKLVKDILKGRVVPSSELSGKFLLYQDGDFRILMSKDSTLIDSDILVHEYTHRLAIKHLKKYRKNLSHKMSSEIIAILNEMKYFDFLKQNGFSEYEIELVKGYQKCHFQEEMATFLFCEPLLDCYLTYGKLTSEAMRNYSDYPYYEIMEDVNYELQLIEEHPGKIKEYLDYIHPTAMMVASFLHQQPMENRTLRKMLDKVSLNDGEFIFPKVSQKQLVDSVKKEFVLEKRK